MIDLNKTFITKEGLLQYIQDVDIYRYYTGKEVKLNTSMSSPLPLRKDNNPSFGYFVGKNDEICFKDFVLGGGDCIKFVEMYFGLNYFEALSKIAIDFNIDDKFIVKQTKKTSKQYNPNNFIEREKLMARASSFNLAKTSRKWKMHDTKYWMSYGINIDVLKKYNVEPLEYIFINNNPIKADKYCYCFTEYKDNKETYKIYQPFNEQYKWLNNHDASVWQGWSQLPEKGFKLVITKSLKDVMSIVSLTDLHSISLQSESTEPKQNIVNYLHDKFELIYLLYDNDYDKEENWGQKFGLNLSQKYRFFNIKIPKEYKSKDFSDLVKNVGEEKAVKILNHIIENYMPF